MSTSSVTHSVATPVSIDEARLLVNSYLAEYFELKIANAQQLHPAYAKLWESTYALFSAGGKRFRPYMTLLSYQAAGGKQPLEKIVPAASAQEIVHLALLVHDDIIDRDTVRYGVENIAGQYRNAYGKNLTAAESEHYANAAAILAGDLLLSGAYELINRLSLPPLAVSEASQTLTKAFFAVAGGELLDTESAFMKDPASAEAIAEFKTASYSFVGPLVMGAQLAEAPVEYMQLITDFGKNLGIAFQLQDDVLGLFGDTAVTGKTTIGDIREGKRTYLTEQFYLLATATQKKQFDALYGSTTVTESGANIVRSLLRESGAAMQTEKQIELYATKAAEALSQMNLSPACQSAFEELIAKCTKRVK